jgi:HK97 family phage portal protein
MHSASVPISTRVRWSVTSLRYKIARLLFSGLGGQHHGDFPFAPFFTLPGTRRHWELEAGDLWRNSIVSAGVRWYQTAFGESDLCACQLTASGEQEFDAAAPVSRLIQRPNAYYGDKHLWAGTIISWVVDGNAYWIKVRNQIGEVVQLWWIPHWRLNPQFPRNGSEFISHYLYRVEGQDIRIPVSEVVHFRNGVDPWNDRLGLSPLKATLREVVADNEASTYAAAIMRNAGVPSHIISPRDDAGFIPEKDAMELKERWRAIMTGDERGDVLVTPHGVKIESSAFSPEQLALRVMRSIPEERVCSNLGLSPMLLGLGAGLERSTFSNMQEAREAATEQSLIPMQDWLADELNSQLLPDFDETGRVTLRWNRARMRVLQEDQDALAERCRGLWKDGVATLAETRLKLGLPERPETDMFAWQIPGFVTRQPSPVAEQQPESAGDRAVARNSNGA